jgi:hypothetical protein
MAVTDKGIEQYARLYLWNILNNCKRSDDVKLLSHIRQN